MKELIFVICTILFIAGCRVARRPDAQRAEGRAQAEATSPAKKWGATVNGLRCSISADKSVYEVGEQIDVTFQLENIGEQPIYQKAWELTAAIYEDGKATVYKVTSWLAMFSLELRAHNGREYIFSDMYRGHEPPSTYLTLLPGLDLREKSTVSSWYGYSDRIRANSILALPGQYQLTACYSNRGKVGRGPGLPEVRALWTGELRSNTITVTVVQKKPAND